MIGDAMQAGANTPLDAADLTPERILSVAEDELSRIVLDIHDGPVQYLFSALSLLTSLQNELQESAASPEVQARLAQVGMLLESSLYEIRFFLGAFRPPEFRRRSLVSIVEGLVIQHEEWTGATVELETCDIPETVPLAVKMAIYRVLQEALANAYRYAGVEQQRVRLWSEEGAVHLEVVDHGRGFEPPNLDDPLDIEREDHIGLRGMYERARLLGGRFTLESSPGRGTRIYAVVPVG
jgi:signal transduction histidine kinase